MAKGNAGTPIDFNDYIGGEEAIYNATRNLRDLGKQVESLSKLVVDDSGRIKAAFAGIEQAARALQGEGAGLKLTTDADKRLLADYLKQAGELATRKAALKEAAAAQAAAVDRVTDAYKQQQQALKDNKEALRAAAAAGDVEGQKKAATAIRQNAAETKQLGLALRGVNSEFTAAKGSYDALTIANGKLLAQLRGLEGGLNADSKAAQELRGQISANTATLTAFDRQLGQNFRNVGNYPQGLKAVGAGAVNLVQDLSGVTLGLAGVAQGLKAFFDSNVEYSRNLAEVRKTTGLTADEAERLADSLKALDTPTSLAGLLKIASVGGQLGIAKTDLLEFTKAIDVAVQALGNDFTGGAEEIATVLGKIGSVYRKELGPDVAQNILSVGSAVNQLGADGAATAPFLTDVALRVGAVAAQAKIGLPNVLAYAAVLQETGSTSEVAGTALNRFFGTLSTKTKEAYEIAKLANPGLTLKEFSRLVNTDFNQAIQVFLKGLNTASGNTIRQAELLKTLKLQSGEAKNAIVTLAANTELFSERQATANTQLREATSLAAEAAIQTGTLASEVDKVKNNLGEAVTSGYFGEFLKFLVRLVSFTNVVNQLSLIGKGIEFIGQKAGLIKQAAAEQQDYTAAVLTGAVAANKAAASQELLLKQYVALRDNTARTGAQELELARLRAQLIGQTGSAEEQEVQASIDRNKRRVETARASFAADVKFYAKGADEAARAQALAERALSADQLKIVKDVIDARAKGSKVQYEGPAIEAAIKATMRLTEQQERLRQAQAALAKLTPKEAAQVAVEAAEEEAKALEQLDRAALERAKNRKQELQEELADNQRRLADMRAYLEEQGKLFERGQITGEVLKERTAGAQDIITATERRGAAIRISLARAESAEKLVAADNDRIRQSQKKDISEKELADIQAQYAERRTGIARTEAREVEAAYRELQKNLKTEPLDFKIVGLDAETKRQLALGLSQLNDPIKEFEREYEKSINRIKQQEFAVESDLVGQLSRREITQAEFEKRRRANRELANKGVLAVDKKFYKDALADQRKANDDALDDQNYTTQQRIALIEKVSQYTQFAASSVYQIKANFLDAEAQNEQQAYETSLAAAGENTELKAQIERQHQKELKRLAYERAKSERDAALFSIVVSTATAVAKDIAQYGFFGSLPAVAGDLAVGGLQAAVVYSKPLPQYFKGRRGGKAEWAEVAERGPEIIREAKTGNLHYVSKHQVRPLAAGDDVLTTTETSRLLASAGLRQPDRDATFTVQAFSGAAQGARAAQDVREGRGYDELIKGQAAIVQAIETFKPTTVNVHRGSDASVEKSRSITHWMSRRGVK